MPQDAPEDGTRWLSYGELAAVRQISKASAIRLARRRRWLKRRANDGGVRVAVPEGEDQPKRDDLRDDLEDGREDNRQDGLQDIREDISRITNGFEAALTVLREQLTAAEGRAGAERTRAERAEQDRETLRGDLTRAEARVRAVEADAGEWWGRSRWRRAWSGWRGRARAD